MRKCAQPCVHTPQQTHPRKKCESPRAFALGWKLCTALARDCKTGPAQQPNPFWVINIIRGAVGAICWAGFGVLRVRSVWPQVSSKMRPWRGCAGPAPPSERLLRALHDIEGCPSFVKGCFYKVFVGWRRRSATFSGVGVVGQNGLRLSRWKQCFPNAGLRPAVHHPGAVWHESLGFQICNGTFAQRPASGRRLLRRSRSFTFDLWFSHINRSKAQRPECIRPKWTHEAAPDHSRRHSHT